MCYTPRHHQPGYDVSLFNLTHLRENEQDASRGAKQQAFKTSADCPVLSLMPKAKETGFSEGLYRWMQVTISLTFPHFPLYVKCRLTAKDRSGVAQRVAAFYSPPKWTLKSHQFIPAHEELSAHMIHSFCFCLEQLGYTGCFFIVSKCKCFKFKRNQTGLCAVRS